MAKSVQKCKNPKTVKMKIGPYSSPVMFTILYGGKKQAKNTSTQSDLVGLSEKRWKNDKNSFFQKAPKKWFFRKQSQFSLNFSENTGFLLPSGNFAKPNFRSRAMCNAWWGGQRFMKLFHKIPLFSGECFPNNLNFSPHWHYKMF